MRPLPRCLRIRPQARTPQPPDAVLLPYCQRRCKADDGQRLAACIVNPFSSLHGCLPTHGDAGDSRRDCPSGRALARIISPLTGSGRANSFSETLS
jgi:hypothetical protein